MEEKRSKLVAKMKAMLFQLKQIEEARKLVAMHGHWLRMFWPDGLYTPEAHKGLADGYVTDERFRAYYEKVAPGAAQFLRDAIHACA